MNQVTTQKNDTGLSYKNVTIAQTGGGGMLLPQTFGEVVAFATMMARSQHAIPKHLRENDGACMAVTMQALRWEMDPFMVASKSYNVKDLIAYEAQLVAAVVNTRAPIKKRPVYEYDGEGDTRRCIVSCEMLDGSTKTYESPMLGKITTKNSPLWKADPDQQLGYFSIRSWARRHTPEVILGVYTPDEAEQFNGPDNAKDITPQPSVMQRLRQNATQEPTSEREGFDASFVHSETQSALDGEVLDQDTHTESGDTSPPDADGQSSPGSTSAEADPDVPSSGSASSLSLTDRALLIECCAKFMSITVQEGLEPQSRRGVLESAKNAWKKEVAVEHHPKIATFFLAADAIITGKQKNREGAIREFASVLDCTPEELGGAA